MDSEFDGEGIYVRVRTDYPVSGKVEVISKGADSVFFRIHGWCRNFSVDQDHRMDQGYIQVMEDHFSVGFDMEAVYLMANENVGDDADKVAVMRGPVVYCMEGIDHTDALHKIYLDRKDEVRAEESAYFGVPVLKTGGYVRKTGPALYERWEDHMERTQITLIPYFGFANRGETDMRVWLNQKEGEHDEGT